ncbi:putative fructose-2,6-bisphosphatase TIGAR, partial [Stegodyphus mimosarum]
MVVFALTLIRHGETAHNKDNVIQGQMDVPLSQTGLRQAELLGFHLQYEQYSHVYASDLTRAMQTAESIIRQNKSYKASLFHDRRLRERKFGAVEGKSFKYLREAAEKSKQKTGHYTPPGGETIQQVHERAVSFFHDLCEMVKEHSKLESANGSGISRANLNGGSSLENGKQSGQKRKWENAEAGKIQSSECQNRSQSKICVKESQKNEVKISENLKYESGNCNNYEDCNFSAEKDIVDACNRTDKDFFCVHKDITSKQNEDLNIPSSDKGQFPVTFTDEIIRSQIVSSCSDQPNIECPNVSLSPLVDQNFITSVFSNPSQEHAHHDLHRERRLSVCSSCDDADSGLNLTANILVVSHGGWLRELFRHFVEDLECSVPGGKKQALRISPNAGLSKFTVSVEEHDAHPKIICLQIHDKQ